MKRRQQHQSQSKKTKKDLKKLKDREPSLNEHDSLDKIKHEVSNIEKVGRVIPDDEIDERDDIFEEVKIEEEENLSQIPTDIQDDCNSSHFLQRPFEEAALKQPLKIIEKNENYQIQSNYEVNEIITKKNDRPSSVPISFWKEFKDFLKVNELTLNDLMIKEFNGLRNYSDTFIIKHMSDEEFALHRLLTTLHIACHIREIRLLRMKHTFEHKEEQIRDMGLVKPSVLVLFPFKTPAIIFIKTLLTIFGNQFQQNIANEERFAQEFRDVPLEIKTMKPKEFYQIFEGNEDDCFRVGVKFGMNGVHFYSNFYESDLIIASPLGIKTFIAKSNNGEGQDILSSIKVLYLESIDTMEMQNISHLIEIIKKCNKIPMKQHATDIRRVYEHEINEKGGYYRQTIIYSRYQTPLLNSVIRLCLNNHIIQISERTIKGTLSQMIRTIPITFYKYKATTPMNSPDERFEYFTKIFLQGYSDGIKSKTLLYIPSYFDYLRIKQYLNTENFRCICLCEYSSTKAISSARSRFYHEDEWEFFVITERFHFFNRFRIKGIQHLLFYEVPTPTHYVAEFINMIPGSVNDASVHILYNHMDTSRLRSLVGDERAAYLMTTEQNKHTFV
ncbi:hypothetical protein EHI8A_162370 [Entamoeba histolytica HM-1:IMSS-B]|uniref:Digestive organ expansion factor family protein n=6 Tax=Entamoeba histolytica TaxID=5759 RepID=C4LY41_ENTH1|nr:hypothetical protein, conserved [Entamoeba histolytica HM-1:IMSS]EMD47973.1 digestive organ expansion factor family protein [Entamoeba histolytica KU27]EMH73713.1 hypothetical protein EHI8A_162370 [Entamoeba histolytica HM-1:IMSS-B]EMS12347.1 digestive organ expansion factor family protein [Entamoeba histolytica HM-3:IMSS]ENY61723.1 digestive organ expansion factor family protein, putative [Entamoeba histolytica HM-1:IMSS-A]GAT93694.1 hypothetical protein conserved [Entamoeba histolytica]|eukprot:XP_652811.1 hypothetical protein, conserved [Entamoeba histolytica HM-1:IMSS]